MFVSELLGMMVIDVDTGRKVGYVCDVKLSRDKGLIESLIVSEGKNKFISRLFYFFRRVEIFRENIVMFGEDLVAVKTY